MIAIDPELWQICRRCDGEGCQYCHGQGSFWLDEDGTILDGLPQVDRPVYDIKKTFIANLATESLKEMAKGHSGEFGEHVLQAKRELDARNPISYSKQKPKKRKGRSPQYCRQRLLKMHPNQIRSIAQGKNKDCQGAWITEAQKLI